MTIFLFVKHLFNLVKFNFYPKQSFHLMSTALFHHLFLKIFLPLFVLPFLSGFYNHRGNKWKKV